MESKYIVTVKSETRDINMEISAESETAALAEAWKLMKDRESVRYMTAQPVYAIVLTTEYGLRREVIPADSEYDAVCELARRGFNVHEIWSIDQIDAEIEKLSSEMNHMRKNITAENPLTGKLLTKRNPGDVWMEEINGHMHRMECLANGYICQTRI